MGGRGTPKVSPSRLAAFEILAAVGSGTGHSDELLHSKHVDTLSPEDRNLCTTLVMGVLRWQIALDARLRGLLQRPEQRLADPVAIALRMGAFQLLYLDRVPAHAALNESVELCREAGHPYAAGMVNAVLRKLTSSKKPGAPIYESVAALAERLGHPAWLVERWAAVYGREAAQMICEADQREPSEGKMFTEYDDMPVMDDGSRLVAELAAAAAPEAKRVWDCCAAPGGKTLVLAKRLAAASIIASDVSAKRLAAMKARFRRLDFAERIECVVADAADADSVQGEFNLIVCDAPCSGTGTLAANPEIRHRLQPADLARQAARQRMVLKGALRRLASGGRLVYSTCSLEPEECEQVVSGVTGVRRVPVEGLLGELNRNRILQDEASLESAVRDGALRTLPGVHECDGFFAVVFERT